MLVKVLIKDLCPFRVLPEILTGAHILRTRITIVVFVPRMMTLSMCFCVSHTVTDGPSKHHFKMRILDMGYEAIDGSGQPDLRRSLWLMLSAGGHQLVRGILWRPRIYSSSQMSCAAIERDLCQLLEWPGVDAGSASGAQVV